MPKGSGNKELYKKGWKPGQSGNPGGRPKLNKEVTELALKEATDAFMRIVEISIGGEDDRVRLQANQYIVDRAVGKPAQAINLGDHEGGGLKINVIIEGTSGGT